MLKVRGRRIIVKYAWQRNYQLYPITIAFNSNLNTQKC